MLWLYNRGDYKGILKSHHLYSIGQLMLAFRHRFLGLRDVSPSIS